MLPWFPVPYPDELLYSVIARYAEVMGFPSTAALHRSLWGRVLSTRTVFFLNFLGALIARLPLGSQYTATRLIDEHTIFPYYQSFLTRESAADLRHAIISTTPSFGWLSRSGLNATMSRDLPCRLRYCPMCANLDRSTYGETYWHCTHQLPYVEVCPLHGAWLESSEVPAISLDRKQMTFTIADCEVRTRGALSVAQDWQSLLFLRIARDSTGLLHSLYKVSNLTVLVNKLRWALVDAGYASYGGVIYHKKLSVEFQDFFGEALLEKFKCPISPDLQSNWLDLLLRSPLKCQSPIRYILLSYLLSRDIAEIIINSAEFHPFGEGPWPCLNLVCPQYRKPVIEKARIELKGGSHAGKPHGTFSCKYCGFEYVRLGPDESVADRYRVGRVVSYGSVWDSELQRLWNNSEFSIKHIGRLLGIAETAVAGQALRLGLSFPRPLQFVDDRKTQEWTKRRVEFSEALLQKHRNTWIAVVRGSPDLRVQQLRERCRATYSFLARHDPGWLRQHVPASRESSISTNSYPDIEELDARIASAIRLASDELRQVPGRPEWITETRLLKWAGLYSIYRYRPDSYPTARQVLENAAETREQHLVRCVQWAAQEFLQERILPSYEDLRQRSGKVRSPLYRSPAVVEAIEAAMAELQRELTELGRAKREDQLVE